MSGKRGPNSEKFFPINGLVGNKLIWSLIIINSPTSKEGFMPPQALLTQRVFTPIAFIILTGNVTCCMV